MKKRLVIIVVMWFLSLCFLFFGRENGLAICLAIDCFGAGLYVMIDLWHSDKHVKNWKNLAYQDELTGLLNRRGLLATTMPLPYCVVMLDIDNFKAINDEHGHTTGDAVLKHLAHNLDKNSRHGDVCARWGGDEFIVVLSGANQLSAQIFVNRLGEKLTSEDLPVYSFGAGYADSKDEEYIEALINRADADLLVAKRASRASKTSKPSIN